MFLYHWMSTRLRTDRPIQVHESGMTIGLSVVEDALDSRALRLDVLTIGIFG